jgi:3'-5' exoribonuclease 1
VKPSDKPKLSPFCTRLTGITQTQVDEGVSLSDALQQAHSFLANHGLVHGDIKSHVLKSGSVLSQRGDFTYPFAFLTDGPWDLGKFLHAECQRKRLGKPKYYDQWVNLKWLFCDYYHARKANIARMLRHYSLEFQGSPHSGLDDAVNIARIAAELSRAGCPLRINDGIGRKTRPR